MKKSALLFAAALAARAAAGDDADAHDSAARAAHAFLYGDPKAVAAKLLDRPAYKAFRDEARSILRGKMDAAAKVRALKQLRERNWTVITEAMKNAGLVSPHLQGQGPRRSVRFQGASHGILVLADDRVFSPPFAAIIANSGEGSAATGMVLSSMLDDFDDWGGSLYRYRTYVVRSFKVPQGVKGVELSAELQMSNSEVITSCGYGAYARAGVFLRLEGPALPDLIPFRVDQTLLLEDHGPAAGEDSSTGASGPVTLKTMALPVKAGEEYRVQAGVSTSTITNLGSWALAFSYGHVKRIVVHFVKG